MAPEEKIIALNRILEVLGIAKKTSFQLKEMLDNAMDFIFNVKKGLEDEIELNSPKKDSSLEISIRNNSIEPYLNKFYSNEFRFFIKFKPIDVIKEVKEICYSDKQIERDREIYISRDEDFKNVYNRKLDFYAVCLGFEGYLEAKIFNFDIKEKWRENKKEAKKIKKEVEQYALKQKEKEESSKAVLNRLSDFLFSDPKFSYKTIKNNSTEYLETINELLAGELKKRHIFELNNNFETAFLSFLDKILVSEKLSKNDSLRSNIDDFFNTESKKKNETKHKELLSSVLSVSLLKKWDWYKLNYLKLLLESDNSWNTVITERCAIGFAISLIITNDKRKIEATKKIINSSTKRSLLIPHLYEVLNSL
ncbi:MAG: hypothetical protein ACWIPJ_10855, partial [Polaribacter sp.]